jgi:hypothetical protein
VCRSRSGLRVVAPEGRPQRVQLTLQARGARASSPATEASLRTERIANNRQGFLVVVVVVVVVVMVMVVMVMVARLQCYNNQL